MATVIVTTKWIFFLFQIQLSVFEISCGLFNLDAKDVEKSSAQVV